MEVVVDVCVHNLLVIVLFGVSFDCSCVLIVLFVVVMLMWLCFCIC